MAGQSIMLIEDNPDHVLLIQAALEDCRHAPHLQVLADGEQALRYIQASTTLGPGAGLPRLVLLDLKLPKVDGLDILRAMRASSVWREVPVVVISTSNRPADVEACYASGASAYLAKIGSPETFASRVCATVSRWL